MIYSMSLCVLSLSGHSECVAATHYVVALAPCLYASTYRFVLLSFSRSFSLFRLLALSSSQVGLMEVYADLQRISHCLADVIQEVKPGRTKLAR